MKRLCKAAGEIGILLLGLCSGAVLAAAPLEPRTVSLSPDVKIGERVGRLRFLGMLELPDITHNGVRLSQLSGLAWDDDDGILYAVSDKGGLFHLRPEFKGDFLSGLRLLHAFPLSAPDDWKSAARRLRPDAEGLDILNGRNGRKADAELIVSIERVPRILRYRPNGQIIGEHRLPTPLNDVRNYANANKTLEAVCADPVLGILTAPEAPLKNEPPGHTHIFGLSGKWWDYPLPAGERITDMECVAQGEALILQQNYQLAFGQITVTLKRIRPGSTPSSKQLQPETVFTLDNQKGFNLDNFEGLARHRNGRFFMVSDNNDLFIQRTLLMYFEIQDQ